MFFVADWGVSAKNHQEACINKKQGLEAVLVPVQVVEYVECKSSLSRLSSYRGYSMYFLLCRLQMAALAMAWMIPLKQVSAACVPEARSICRVSHLFGTCLPKSILLLARRHVYHQCLRRQRPLRSLGA